MNKLKWLTAIISAVLFYYASKIEPHWVEITHVPLKLAGLPPEFNGYHIVQISDFHYGSHITLAQLAQYFDMVKECKPHLICITGDFISARSRYDKNRFIETLRLLQYADDVPVVAVPGNHAYKDIPQIEAIREIMQQSGMIDLSNRHITIRRGDGVLHVAGVDDVVHCKSLLHKVLNDLPDDGLAILLAHEPDFATISAPTGRFALQLSGHTHGGQVRFPFTKRPLLQAKYGRMYNAGLYDVAGTMLYVNRGLGTVSFRIRLNCRPEITVFELQYEA